jgi:chromosome segregation ATPase
MQQPPLDDDFQSMQREIEDRIASEHDLIQQIQNLTASLATFAQREDLHVRQLDVLTERVMDAEAAAASERNELLEYRANCTELGRTIATMQDELEEWKNRCEILTEQHERDEERGKEIQETLKERDSEVEELASSIETARLSTEREKYFAARQAKKKRGFFAWLFGIGQYESDDDEERLQVS